MFRLLPFSFILQGFCMYHAYKNDSEQKWYWLIMVFPFIGSGIYIYHHFYNRQNIKQVSEGLKSVVNTNYAVEKLEKEVKFSETIQNQTRLADKYIELGRYSEAVELYELCLRGFNKDNPEAITKLVGAYYLNEDFSKSAKYGDAIKSDFEFKQTKEFVFYAWSLFKMDRADEAEQIFKQVDKSYCNYPHRLEYAKFLFEKGEKENAITKLEELLEENADTTSEQKRLNKGVFRVIQLFYKEVKSS